MMTNVMVKTCLNQKIIKNSNLIQGSEEKRMSDSECYRKADFFRKPNFPKFPNCGFNTRHDNREVKLIKFFESLSKAEFVRIFTECSEVWIEHTT